jgi:hypothetical protein
MDRTGVKEGESTVLLLAIDDNLFKTCFGADPLWPCKLECLSEKCTESELTTSLKSSYCVVVDDEEECPHWETVKQYYRDGGLVVWFGIFGEFSTPAFLSREFGLEWKFSAYTKHDYVLTSVGKHVLGDAISEQQYTKSNLLAVPEQDRIMIPKGPSWEDFVEEADETDEESPRIQEKYDRYRRELDQQVPLAMHRANDHGGRIAYLGFVNGDGNIPKFVRALCSGTKVMNEE